MGLGGSVVSAGLLLPPAPPAGAETANFLQLSGPQGTDPGVAFQFTVTAQNSGQTVTSYADTVHFVSTDAHASLPGDYTFTAADAGTHTFTATLNTAGTQFIQALDQNDSSITNSGLKVTVSGAGAATHLLVSAPPTAVTGSPFNFTVTAQDASNNTVTGYGSTVHFISSDPSASLPGDYTFTAADAGRHTFTATLNTTITTTTQVIIAQDLFSIGDVGGLLLPTITGTSGQILVGAPVLFMYPVTGTAGSLVSFTVTVFDANGGGIDTTYPGTIHFTSTDPKASLPGDYTFTAADRGTHTFSAIFNTEGQQTVTITGTDVTTPGGNVVVVNSATNDASQFDTMGGGSVTAGASRFFSITALDPAHTTDVGYTGTVHFTSTDPKASLPADYTFTAADAGTHTFSAILDTTGTQGITITDTANSSLTSTLHFTVAAAPHFVVAPALSTEMAGSAFSFGVEARNASNTTDTGYRGRVHFTSTDPKASLPADYTFTTADAGTHRFSVTLNTPGTQSLTATDTANSLITGTKVFTVTGGSLTVTAPSPSMTYGGPVPDLAPSYDGFVNGDTAASLTTPATCTTAATSASPPGTYPVTCTGAVDPNYSFSYQSGTLTVTGAPLTVSAPSPSMSYGSPVPSALTPTYSGFVNGDNANSLSTQPTCTTTATSSSPVGIYPVTCSGAVDPNYSFTYVAGTLTVSPAPLTVTANNQTKQFGAALPTLTATISGFVNGETLSTSGVTGSASCSTTATASSPVGTYPITCTLGSLTASNYAFTSFNQGTLTVAAAETVTGSSSGQVTVGPGQSLLLSPGSTVAGPVTVQPGGSLEADGATITGPLKATGPAAARLCNANVTGPTTITTISGATGLVVVGDDDGATACAGNHFSGPVSITNDTGGVEFDGNTITGPLTITGNTGTLPAPDTGAVDATGNTVSGPSNVQSP